MNLPSDIPQEAIPILNEMGYLEPDRLKVGDLAPCITLTRLDSGEAQVIGASHVRLPVVLIFGSYTYEKLFAQGICEATISAIESSAELLGEDIATAKKLWRPIEQVRKWVLNEFPLLGPLAAQLKIIADSGVYQREDIGVAVVNPFLGEVYFNPDRPMSESEVRSSRAQTGISWISCY